MYVAYPYHLDSRGRTTFSSSPDDHISEMLEQLLLTNPGERVNRPDFGCGLGNLVFEPNSTRLAAALEVSVVNSVAQWLGDVIQLQNVDIEAQDEKLLVNISYLIRATGDTATTAIALSTPT
jgi:uncharacterized protein